MPSKAISEDVSNPSPNKTPNGYIFHGLLYQSSSNIKIFMKKRGHTYRLV
jgi:hypothetical protein